MEEIKEPDKPEEKKDVFTPTPEEAKAKWLAVDELCPTCNKVWKPAKGWNRQNMKRLLWRKLTPNDYFMIFFFIMIILLGMAYKHDTEMCRGAMNDLPKVCADYGIYLNNVSNFKCVYPELNVSKLKVINLSVPT